MIRRTTLMATTVAAGLALSGTAAHAAPDPKTTATSEETEASATFSLNERTHSVKVERANADSIVTNGSGRVLSSRALSRSSFTIGTRHLRTDLASATQAGGSYECVANRKRRGFASYDPLVARTKNDGREFQYLFFPFKQNRARRRGGRVTKQIEMCSIGGGHAKGGRRLHRAHAHFTVKDPATRIVGYKWGTGTEKSTASASLGFSVPIRAVTISGTLNVHPESKLTGGQGSDKDKDFGAYSFNQVNGLWEGGVQVLGRWLRTSGSTHFQGNVAHALWEYPQTDRDPQFSASAGLDTHCGRLAGIGCAD